MVTTRTFPFAAFSTRLFSVLRFESVIHEFDPYFNYRTTKYLAEEGFYKFHNWFDERAWYPLGRIIGGKDLWFIKREHGFSCSLILSSSFLFIYRNYLSWFDGNISCFVPCHELVAHLYWCPKCLCLLSSSFFKFDNYCHLSPYKRIESKRIIHLKCSFLIWYVDI